MYIDCSLKNRTILITGGAGFIGSSLAHYLEKYHPRAKVVVFDSFRSLDTFPNGNYKSLGHFKNLIGFRGDVISGNINNREDLDRLRDYKFDYIFHQAAISDTTVLDQELMIRTNTNAFKDILDLAIKSNATLIYASSAGTYGNSKAPNSVGVGEFPENVYGFSKLMMDNLAYEYMKRDKIKIFGLRYFNVYGEREYYKGKTASMILQLGLNMLSGKNPRIFKYGEQKRDFIYIQDVIQANIKCIESENSGVYNVGTGKSRTFNDIVNILKDELKLGCEIEYFDNPYKFYQNHTEADIIATKEFLNYEPNYTLELGIKSYKDEIVNISKGIESGLL